MSHSDKHSPASALTRRSFLKNAAALGGAAAFPNIITGCATSSGARRPAPSERVTMGVIGYGWQGSGNTQNFLRFDTGEQGIAVERMSYDAVYDRTRSARCPRVLVRMYGTRQIEKQQGRSCGEQSVIHRHHFAHLVVAQSSSRGHRTSIRGRHSLLPCCRSSL